MNENKLNKYYLEYEEAVDLKILGYDEECTTYYNSSKEIKDDEGFDNHNLSGKYTSRPQYQQALAYFREVHLLDGKVTSWTEGGKLVWYYSNEPVGKPSRYKGYVCTAPTHEHAQYELVKDLIRTVKEKQNDKL